MTLLTVPVYSRDHSPHLPILPERKLNWMGKIIRKIHASKEQGFIHKIIIHAFAIFASFALVLSYVGIPLFIYAFREYTRQECRNNYDRKYRHLLQIATEHAKHQFLKGRIGPFDSMDIHLSSSTRKKMIHDLEISEKDAINKLDIDLLRMAAAKYSDYLVRYNMKIRA